MVQDLDVIHNDLMYKERYYDSTGFKKIKNKNWYKKINKNGVESLIYHREGDVPAFIAFSDDGCIVQEAFYKDGEMHRDNGPAHIIYLKNGCRRLEYYNEGKFVDNGISSVLLNKDGDQIRRKYTNDGVLSCEEYISRDVSGNILRKAFVSKGKYNSRGDSPAVITFKSGKIYERIYYKDGIKHREGSNPAYIKYKEDGSIAEAKYYKNGKLHNDGSYAHLIFGQNGATVEKHCYIEGVECELNNLLPLAENMKLSDGIYSIPSRDKIKAIGGEQLELDLDSAIYMPFTTKSTVGFKKILNEQGKLHNERGPALLLYDVDDGKKHIEYRINGKLHRTDGPARSVYHPGSYKIEEEWVEGNKKTISYTKADEVYKIIYDNGIIKSSCSYKNNKLNDNLTPAYISYYKTGMVQQMSYYKDGLLHREGENPSRMKFFMNGERMNEEYCKNGKLHRENGPAYVSWSRKGDKTVIAYYQNGKLHRVDGPAHTSNLNFDSNGKYTKESTYIDGKFISAKHIYKNGDTFEHSKNSFGNEYKSYKKNGLYHKDDGAAIISFHPNGKIKTEQYRIKGILHNKNGPAIVDYNKEGEAVYQEYWNDGKLHKTEFIDDGITLESNSSKSLQNNIKISSKNSYEVKTDYKTKTIDILNKFDEVFFDLKKEEQIKINEPFKKEILKSPNIIDENSKEKMIDDEHEDFEEDMIDQEYDKLIDLITSDYKKFSRKYKLEESFNTKNFLIGTESAFYSMFKSDSTKAAYRMISKQLSCFVRNLIVLAMKSQGYDENVISAILESAYGEGLMSFFIGVMLEQAYKKYDDDRIIRLADEFRQNGMAVCGNALIEHIVPAVVGVFTEMDKEEIQTNTRIVEESEEEIEVMIDEAGRSMYNER